MYAKRTTESRKMGCARSENDGQSAPLNAPIMKRRTACDGEFNTYAGERDDTALLFFIKRQEVQNMNEQRLFSEEELARVETEEERKHLIECEKDNSKIDMRYFNIMEKYDLWEKKSTGEKIKENLKEQGFLSWAALIVAIISILVKLLK